MKDGKRAPADEGDNDGRGDRGAKPVSSAGELVRGPEMGESGRPLLRGERDSEAVGQAQEGKEESGCSPSKETGGETHGSNFLPSRPETCLG